MNKKIIVLVIAVLVVGGAAYGLTRNKKTDTNSTGSTSNTSQTSSTNPTSSSSDNMADTDNSSSTSNTPESTNAVTINNFAFAPKDITVKKGTTVTWTNKDSVAHNVQETDGKSGPKSTDLPQGASYTYTFTAAGTFAYHCSIHPDMTGTVTVTE